MNKFSVACLGTFVLLTLASPVLAGYAASPLSTTSGTDSGGASSSVLRLEVTSVSNGSNYVTFRVSKKDGTAFTTSGTLTIRKNCGTSSCTTVASSSISAGSSSRSFSVYMPTHVTGATGGKNFYGRYFATSNGFWSYAGPINVYAPSLSRPSSTSTSSITTTSARLNWGPVQGAENYRYQATDASSFQTNSDGSICYNCISGGNGTTTSTSRTITGLQPSTTYRWRVRAGNATTGQGSNWSSIRAFTTRSPTVTSVSPLVATLDELTTFTVYGSDLVSGMGFWIDQCSGITGLGGTSSYQRFRCTPQFGLGPKAGEVKVRPGGTLLHTFTVDVQTSANVTGVSPSTATLDQLTTFTVTGSNLPSGMGFWIDQCEGVAELSGSSSARRFRCTPRWELGSQPGVIRVEPNGQLLHNFSVNVTTAVDVDRVDPVRAVRNTRTVFTIQGSNLTSGMGFWVANCGSVIEESGGSASERRFSCIPGSSLGTVAGEIKTSPGGALLHNFSVEVIAAPVVNEVVPVRAGLGTETTFAVRGSNLPAGLAFWVDQCTGVTELSGGHLAERLFRCRPQFSLGSKNGVVKVAELGTELRAFSVEVITLPTVDVVEPVQAALGVATTYAIRGSNLPSGLAFWIADCEGVSERPGGSSTERQFVCTPSHSFGPKSGVVKVAADGTTLEDFTVNVIPLPVVADIKPVRAAFGVRTRFTVRGSDLPVGMGFYIAECEGVQEIGGGNSSTRYFECTPSHSLGTKAGVVKVANGGTELRTFSLDVIPEPHVVAVSPLSGALDMPVTITVSGTDLPSEMAFWIGECAGVEELPGGSSSSRSFRCTPSFTTGTKNGVIKVAEDGTELFAFMFEVFGPPEVASVSPLEARIDEPTTFSILGANLDEGLVFEVADCEGVIELPGGDATSRAFRCTPRFSTGAKVGSVSAADGTLLHSFTVQVTTPSGTTYLNVSDWAQAAADFLVQSDIVDDPPDHDLRGIFDGNRAEFVTLLYRGLGGGKTMADATFATWYGSEVLPLFADVADPDVWYFKPASYLGRLHYLDDGAGITVFDAEPCIFRPAQTLSRGWILKALLEALNIPPVDDFGGVLFFDDVPASHPAAGYIYAAQALGVISGTDNLYRPDEPADRQDLFVMLHRILEPAANPLGVAVDLPTPMAMDFRADTRCSKIGRRYEQPIFWGVQAPTVEISPTMPVATPETIGSMTGVYTADLQAIIADLDTGTFVDGDGVSHQAMPFCAWTADGGVFLDLAPGSSEPGCHVKWIAPIDASQATGAAQTFTIMLFVGDGLGSEVRRQVTVEILAPSGDSTPPILTMDPLPTGLVGGELMEISGTVVDGGDPDSAEFGVLSVALEFSSDGGGVWSGLGYAELLEGGSWRYPWQMPLLFGEVRVRAIATNLRGNRVEVDQSTTVESLLSIRGVVVDSFDQPVVNALVALSGSGLGGEVLSDHLGSFRFTSLEHGIALGPAYALTVSFEGRSASEDGLTLSAEAPEIETILVLDTAPPLTVASVAGGTYHVPQTVELFCSDDRSGCDTTYYTTDGSVPTLGSLIYSGPLTLADATLQFFSVDQQGNPEPVNTEVYAIDPCTYSLDRASENFDAAGGTGAVTLETTAGCPWDAVSSASWIEITSPASGIGPDQLSYSVLPHSGAVSRQGEIQLEGEVLGIVQEGVGYTLTVVNKDVACGTVSSMPAGINCGSVCSGLFSVDTPVTLVATPMTGCRFVGWSGAACLGTGACLVTIDGDQSVTATFEPLTYTLTVDREGEGTGRVASDPPGIDCGSDCDEEFNVGLVIILTAEPAPGSQLEGWSGADCPGTSTCTVTMDQAVAVTATFERIPYTLSVSKTGDGAGTVTSAPGEIDCGDACSDSFLFGTDVTLTAIPEAGSAFLGWGDACAGPLGCSLTIEGDTNVEAIFVTGCIDTMEGGAANWIAVAGPLDPGGTPPWELVTSDSHSPEHAWFAIDEEAVADRVLRIALVAAIPSPASSPIYLQFWHRYNTEPGHDGGVLEASIDGGLTWFDIVEGDGNSIPAYAGRLLSHGYDSSLVDCCQQPLPGRSAWSGDSDGWVNTIIDLSDFEGLDTTFRWRFVSDELEAVQGWWIDDVQILGAGSCPVPVLFYDGFESGDTAAWGVVTGQ